MTTETKTPTEPRRGRPAGSRNKPGHAAGRPRGSRNMGDLRFCPACRSRKPRTEFYVRSNGYRLLWCKPCMSQSQVARVIAKRIAAKGVRGALEELNTRLRGMSALVGETLKLLDKETPPNG